MRLKLFSWRALQLSDSIRPTRAHSSTSIGKVFADPRAEERNFMQSFFSAVDGCATANHPQQPAFTWTTSLGNFPPKNLLRDFLRKSVILTENLPNCWKENFSFNWWKLQRWHNLLFHSGIVKLPPSEEELITRMRGNLCNNLLTVMHCTIVTNFRIYLWGYVAQLTADLSVALFKQNFYSIYVHNG